MSNGRDLGNQLTTTNNRVVIKQRGILRECDKLSANFAKMGDYYLLKANESKWVCQGLGEIDIFQSTIMNQVNSLKP